MSDVDSEFDDEGSKLGEYEGDRNQAGERHGFGKAVLPNGDIYHGQYESGKRHGQLKDKTNVRITNLKLLRSSDRTSIIGTYRFKNGAKYVGDYYQGVKHGQGTFYYPDGSKYKGSWVEDLRQGHGVYTYPNGDIYDGEWLRHMRHGQGIYHYHECGAQFKGTWVNGKMQAAGEYIYSNHRYKGNFTNNKPYGLGKYVFDIGCEQHGEYEQTKQDQAEGEMDEFNPDPKWIPHCTTGLTQWTPSKETTGELCQESELRLEE